MIFGFLSLIVLFAFLGVKIADATLSKLYPYLMVAALSTTATYLLFVDGNTPKWFNLLACVFGGFFVGLLFNLMSKYVPDRFIFFSRVSLAKFKTDFRTSAVLSGLLLAYILTFYFAHMSRHDTPDKFWFSYYTSWISGLVLFSVVGLVLGLVSLYRPEKDVFDARMKILVGGRSSPAVQHLSEELRKHAIFASKIRRTITFESYDKERNAVKIRTFHESILENLFSDVTSNVEGRISIKPDHFDNPPEKLGTVESYKVGEQSLGTVPVHFDQSGLKLDWSHTIPEGGNCVFSYEHTVWADLSKEHIFRPARYTSSIDSRFICRIPDFSGRIKVVRLLSSQNEEASVAWGEDYSINNVEDIAPGAAAYKLSFAIDC